MAKSAAPKGKASSKGSTYDDTNRGVLFVNDKDGNDARPDFTGKLSLKVEDFEVDGDGNIEVRLAAWRQDSPKIGEYLSVAASVPKQKE